jgi:polyhydroxyalkanoate synthase
VANAPETPTDFLSPWLDAMAGMQKTLADSGVDWLPPQVRALPGVADPAAVARATEFWTQGMALWQRFLDPAAAPPPAPEPPERARDKRFAAPAWREPAFDLLRRGYYLLADHVQRQVEELDVDEKQRERLRFAARAWIDAISPSNFPFTNPEVIETTLQTNGENLRIGLRNLMADLGRGQVTHTDANAFEVGRNIATTPGKVIKRTPLYELIQYAPVTDEVLATPLVIFPPWINRFYILDLSPEKSLIRWATEQGLTVFMVSWKSADASTKDVIWDNYVAAQIDAIDTVRDLLDVPAVHTVGYCVAGTTLAATLALLTARGQADRVASATFLTAQVDFARAGELKHFVDDEQLRAIAALTPDGFLDGRYMAMTFNLLRGRDLIWNYVTNNYWLGKDYAPFDLLHWNGDTTNLPAKWHLSYLTDLYRDNLLATPGAMSIAGVGIDLSRVTTPAYVQAGREDHIAPAESVWAITHHFKGPLRFVLAGSGHIAGVINPPAAGKYQHWINDAEVDSLAEFVAGATEVKGSWWPDWLGWLRDQSPSSVAATRARIPGEGGLQALEDAPGSYVRAR